MGVSPLFYMKPIGICHLFHPSTTLEYLSSFQVSLPNCCITLQGSSSFCTMCVHVTAISCHPLQCMYTSLLSAIILYSVCTCYCYQLSFCTVYVHFTVVSCHSVQCTHTHTTITLLSFLLLLFTGESRQEGRRCKLKRLDVYNFQ